MYQPINPIPGQPGSFQAFVTADGEGLRQEWIAEWAATCTKRNRTVCRPCRGFGVLKGEAMGCPHCHGEGSFP